MSEPTIEEILGGNVNDTINDTQEDREEESTSRIFNLSILKSETGEGSIESYLDHPLNFQRSLSLARIIRGLSGIIGNLNLAIIDIVIGLLEFFKGRKAMPNE